MDKRDAEIVSCFSSDVDDTGLARFWEAVLPPASGRFRVPGSGRFLAFSAAQCYSILLQEDDPGSRKTGDPVEGRSRSNNILLLRGDDGVTGVVLEGLS